VTLGLWLLGPSLVSAQVTLNVPADVSAEERARLDRVASAAAVTTRVQAEPFVARRVVFEYLLEHPEFASHVARTLKFSKLRIWATPEGLYADEGWGTTGLFSVVHAGDGERIIYARGQHVVGPLPPIRGEAVVQINYQSVSTPTGRDVITTVITGFVKLDSRIVSAGLKLVSGIAQRKADREARGLVKLFAKVSRAIEETPATVYDKLRAQPDVPRHELEEFRALLNIP
jgi:hypothetical protein